MRYGQELGLEQCEEMKQATALKARLEEEQFTLAGLTKAMEEKDMTSLSAFLAKCSEMGLATPEVDQVRAVRGVGWDLDPSRAG